MHFKKKKEKNANFPLTLGWLHFKKNMQTIPL